MVILVIERVVVHYSPGIGDTLTSRDVL